MTFLRAYPKLHDLINDLLGTSIVTPIQSYGFFVALALASAALLVPRELKRKEKQGLLRKLERTKVVGKDINPLDMVFQAITGFLIGWKAIGAILNWSAISMNPQKYLVSSEGSIIGGLAVAGFFVYTKYKDVKKQVLPKPKKVTNLMFPHQLIGEMIITAAITGVLGAKIFTYIDDPASLTQNIKDPSTFFSGLTIYGGFICGGLGLWWYCWKNKLNVLHLFDAAGPAVWLAYGIGRLGCQTSGDGDWGVVAGAKPDWLSWLPDMFWSQTYKYNVAGDGELIPGCTGDYCTELAAGVYPTSIYEFTMGVLIFALLWGFRKKINITGMMFAFFLIFNGAERFLIEKIRVNKDTIGSWTQAEIISAIVFVAGIGLAIYLWKKGKREYATPDENQRKVSPQIE